MKKRILIISIVLFLLNTQIIAMIRIFTLLEKIERSNLIVLVEYANSYDTFETGHKAKGGARKYSRYVNYKVKEVLKGIYNKKILQIDYKITNDTYEPFTCQAAVYPQAGEAAILFLEPGMIIFHGLQGKIDLRKHNEKSFIEGLKEIIKIETINDDKLKANKLVAAYYSKNKELKLMARDVIVDSWRLKEKEYGPVLVDVLGITENNPNIRALRYRAAKRLANTKAENASEILTEYLNDKDPMVRKSCTEALIELEKKKNSLK
ncbi:MAG: HEAT repeat domain-containing protein [Elusimicrobiota bacterium]